MKHIFVFTLSLVLLLCACGQRGPTWQEQYDLGLRYLSEGNYEEAILAFTAAIEIDPKQALSYVGRGDAYICFGETVENLTATQVDYEKAIELDETNASIYIKLAQIHVEQENYIQAENVLRKGLDITGEAEIEEILNELLISQKNYFTNDMSYVPNGEVSGSLMNYLSSVVDTLRVGDTDATLSILEKGYHESMSQTNNAIRTEISEYKINYIEFPSNINRIEIRPKTGIAYGVEYIGPRDDIGLVNGFFIIKGQCQDWNWNGSFESHDYTRFATFTSEQWRVGTMKDCLPDGTGTRKFLNSDSQIVTEETVYNYGIIQPHHDYTGHLQPGGDTYYTEVFNTGGWTSLEDAKESLWWN